MSTRKAKRKPAKKMSAPDLGESPTSILGTMHDFGHAVEIRYIRDGKRYRHTWPIDSAPRMLGGSKKGSRSMMLMIAPVTFTRR
jgi:hypothetical protein